MKNRRTQLTYAAFLFALAAVIVGCSSIFEPAGRHAHGSAIAGDVQPSKAAVKIVRDVGDAFGPPGSAISDVIIGGLILGSHFLNKRTAARAIEQHKKEWHDPGRPS